MSRDIAIGRMHSLLPYLLFFAGILSCGRRALARADGGGRSNVSVDVLNNLSFGTVVIGRDSQKRIALTDPDAARALVQGISKNESVTMTFYLPVYLEDGSDRLQIQFDASSAAWSPYDDPASAIQFDPNSPLRLPVSAFVTGKLYLWLGGTIVVAPQQASGQYGGTVRVQVSLEDDED